MPTPEELQASDDAYNQATISQNNAAAAHAALSSAPTDGSTPAWDAHDARNKPPENTVARWMMNLPQNIGTSLIDAAVSTADTFHSIAGWADQHKDHLIADAYNGAVNATSDAMTSASNAVSRGAFAAVGQKAPAGVAAAPPEPVVTKPDPVDPVYDHTRSAVMALRDHLTVQDPNTADEVTQGLLRVAIPAVGFSRLLSGFGVASKLYNAIGTDALTGGLSQGAHDPRMADMLALGRHVESKYIDAMNTADDTGGLLNHYINWMTDRSTESDAEGHFKNALDFAVGGTALAPLFHAVPQVLKQGMDGLATAMDAGIGKTSDVFSGPAYQKGMIGFHGSNTEGITKFDSKALGEDEKSASHGHGLYVADDQDAAKIYAKSRDSLYKVGIADEHLPNMLDWQKPLAEQPGVLAKLKGAGLTDGLGEDATGQDLMEKLGKTRATSLLLDKLGIPGLRYPALGKYSNGGSKGAVSVVFNPEENATVMPHGQDMSLSPQERALERERAPPHSVIAKKAPARSTPPR